MTTPTWAPGTLYPTGFIVQPLSAAPPVVAAIVNPIFASGLTGWTVAGSGALAGSGGFSGAACVSFTGAPGSVVTTTPFPVVPGQSITAQCQMRAFGGSAGNLGDMNLMWFTAAMVSIPPGNEGAAIAQSGGTTYRTATVSGVAPALAAFVSIRADASPAGGGTVLVDAFSWNYIAPASTSGLIFKAVQPATGTSAGTEPVWPPTVGDTVVDNTVTWEAIAGTRIEWTATPLMVSGPAEPTWPLSPDGTVLDGSVIWTAVPRRVTDEKCPNSKQVVIAESHVFGLDDDIAPFSAATNPLDWTTPGNAGFLPIGLQQSNANTMEVLGLYRKKLVPMNASGTQLWALDPDPELMQPIDQLEGAGSTFYRAWCSVGDDMYYLSAMGVRTVGMTGAARNMSAGDVGMPIDLLVRPEIANAEANGVDPHAFYFPGLGQYLLAFEGSTDTTVFVHTRTTIGKAGGWSRYVFPFEIQHFVLFGNELYIRHGDALSVFDETVYTDELEDTTLVPFPGRVRWNYLDCGQPGTTKAMTGFDFVGTGLPSFSVGWDQRNFALTTTPYAIDADTLVGGIIPLDVWGPSMSMIVDFAGGSAWSLSTVILYVDDLGNGP